MSSLPPSTTVASRPKIRDRLKGWLRQISLAFFFIEERKGARTVTDAEFRSDWVEVLTKMRTESEKSSAASQGGFDEFKDRYFADWKRVREMVQHEDALINNRMTWMLSANAFLFVSFYSLLTLRDNPAFESENDTRLLMVLIVLVCLIGMRVCWHVRHTLGLAYRQISQARLWWYKRFEDNCHTFQGEEPQERTFLDALGHELQSVVKLFHASEQTNLSPRFPGQTQEWYKHPSLVGDDIFPDYPGWLRFSIPSGFILLWVVALVVSLLILEVPDTRALKIHSIVNISFNAEANGGGAAEKPLTGEVTSLDKDWIEVKPLAPSSSPIDIPHANIRQIDVTGDKGANETNTFLCFPIC